MDDRVHFAHPDEEATFHRSRVYYFAPDPAEPVRLRCGACGAVSDESEPRGDSWRAACDALRERLSEDGWTMLCGRDFCPACDEERRKALADRKETGRG